MRWLSLLVIAGGWLALGHLQSPRALAQAMTDPSAAEGSMLSQPSATPPTAAPAAPGSDPSPMSGTSRAPTNPAPIAASPLDTYLLRDSKGNLVPVLDLPFEEFERLLRIRRGLAPPVLPGYSLDVLSVTGSAASEPSRDRRGQNGTTLVDLQVVATIRVRDSDWVRVPLALGKAVLRQPAKYEGPGEHFLTYDPTDDAYVAWLRGADAKPHILSLQVSLPTSRLGDRQQLAIRLPRATESTLRVTVPEPRIEATKPAGEGILSQRSTSGGQSEITVLGPAGDLQLAWQSRPEMAAASEAALEATAEIAVKVEGEDRIRSEARLRVRNPSGPLEAFRVALPLGMEWEPTTLDGFVLSLVTPEPGLPGVPAPPQPQVVDVQLNRPASGTVELRLSAVAIPTTGAARSAAGRGGQGAARTSVAAIAPARFVVEGAIRQRGTIDVSVEGDWQLSWRGEQSVRRLDLPQDPALAKVAARYEYSRQPCNLQLTVSPRPSRIGVEPLHVVTVEGRFARLESTLKYRLRGARAAGLAIDLAGWRLDRVTPVDILDLTSVAANPEQPGPRIIPLLPGAVLGSELELKLEAHQPLDPEAGELSLTMPRLSADVVSPATVVVVPADNVELTPLVDKIERLSLDPTLQPARSASSQQTPIAYREIGSDEKATFAADFRVRTQWTTVGARGKVTIEPRQMLVQQLVDYRIAYERRRTFDLLVPREVAASGTLAVTLRGQALTPLPVADAPLVGDATRFRVAAPSDQLGQCQLQVEYTLPLVEWDAAEPLPLAIPMVVPAEEPHQQVGGQQVEFILEGPWQIDADTSGSDEFSRPTPSPPGTGRSSFVWSRAVPATRWFLRPSAAPIREKSLLSKVWIQTYLDGGLRQERAVLRVATNEPQLVFRLPRAPVAGSVRAAVNAQEAPLVVREPAQVVVTLPSAGTARERTVELWYACEADAPRGALASLGLASTGLRPLSINGAAPPRRVFWQLVVPGEQHLISVPDEYAVESSAADWLPLAGQSVAAEQDRLEAWIGASRQDPLPRGTRQYLFGSVGRLPALDCRLASRRLLLFSASGAVLIGGLILLHVSSIRRPETLLGLAIGGAALAWGWPQAALLLAQGATAGLAVVALFAIWMWTLGRTASPMSTARLAPASTPGSAAPNSGQGSKVELRLVDSHARGSAGLGSVSTATAPAGNPAAESPS